MRPWPGDVRVRTRGDGIFFVPASALPCPPESAGLVTGGVRSRPLEADPSGIWFFAAEYRDEYTDMNATFITAGRETPDPRRALHAPASLFSREAMAVVTATARAEEDRRFLMGAGGAPDPWFYPELLWGGSSEKTVPIDLPDLVAGHVDAPATLRVAVFGFTWDDEVDPDHELIVSVNGAAVADLTWDGRGYVVLEVPLPEGTLREGANTIGLVAPPREGIPRTHGAALDYVEVEYRRRLSVASGPLLLRVDRPGVVEIAGLGRPELRVVEVDETGRGRLVGAAFRAAASGSHRGHREHRGRTTRRTTGAAESLPAVSSEAGRSSAGYTARFRASRAGAGGIYYVATLGQVRAPVDVSGAAVVDLEISEGGFPYERAPARAGKAPARAVYLAVGSERFRWAVKPLLDARYQGGLAPVYVSLESIIDTYGHGRYGAGGIVRLVRELRPRYVLLVGDNSYDYLDRLGTGVDPMVPAMLVRTGGLSQANADALYGDLDCDGTPDVPVGRLPVRTTDELEALVEKIVGRASACRLRGVLVADARDEGTDFAARQDAVAAGFPGVDWVKLYAGVHGEGASIRRSLTEAVNSGAELVVYQGHGSSFRLGRGATILDVNEAARWTESPLVYLSTCWGAYIQKTTEAAVSMAEVMLRSEQGPAAVIGSTAACSQRNQEALLHDFLAALVREGQCTGDALVSAQRRAAERAATAQTEEERQAILDTVRCYALLGDPAMPLVPDNPIPQDTP